MSDLIQLEQVDNILSNIGKEMIKSQNLMKLIKYDTSNALLQSNLDIDEIKNLAGYGKNPTAEQRIYKYPFTDKVLDEPRSELRYFIPNVKPKNTYISELYINFQVVVHNSLIELDDNKLRYWRIVVEMLKSLNGFDCGGIGLFYLNSTISIIPWSDYYSGYTWNMNTKVI